jgi:hypothetical protein
MFSSQEAVIKKGEELLRKKAASANLDDSNLMNKLFLLFNGMIVDSFCYFCFIILLLCFELKHEVVDICVPTVRVLSLFFFFFFWGGGLSLIPLLYAQERSVLRRVRLGISPLLLLDIFYKKYIYTCIIVHLQV